MKERNRTQAKWLRSWIWITAIANLISILIFVRITQAFHRIYFDKDYSIKTRANSTLFHFIVREIFQKQTFASLSRSCVTGTPNELIIFSFNNIEDSMNNCYCLSDYIWKLKNTNLRKRYLVYQMYLTTRIHKLIKVGDIDRPELPNWILECTRIERDSKDELRNVYKKERSPFKP